MWEAITSILLERIRKEFEVYTVTPKNREIIVSIITERITTALQ